MKLFIGNNYTKLCQQAADDLILCMNKKPDPVICVASGDTPAGVYKEITDKVNKHELDISSWHFIGLDEWAGLNGSDEGSCRFHLNNQLLNPLKVVSDKIIFFDGRAKDLQKECEMVEHFISQHGGVDVAVIGLGMNGHIGMNEPGTTLSSRSHVAQLDPITQQVGQKYFKKPQQLNEGLTLGISTLQESKHIFLLVNGSHKATIVKQVIEGEISEKIPGSLLRNHPGLHVYLDAAAAEKI